MPIYKKQRSIKISPETAKYSKKIKLSKTKYRSCFSFRPYDKKSCECEKLVKEQLQRLSQLPQNSRSFLMEKIGYIKCPRDKSKMQFYNIVCNACGNVVGTVYSTDDKLTDWCDFHYLSEHNNEEWRGAFGANVKENKIGIECVCGNDTTASMDLAREFGNNSSRYKLVLNKK